MKDETRPVQNFPDEIKWKEVKEDICGGAQCARQSSKYALEEIIKMAHQRIERLETLRRMFPTEMTREQDDALWHL
jgi:hypothetical protein